MKKFFMKAVSVALVGAMGLAFAGCSGKSNGSDASQGSDASAAQEQFTIEKGKLIMATNAYFPPYEYYDGDKIVGIDVVCPGADTQREQHHEGKCNGNDFFHVHFLSDFRLVVYSF